MLKFHALVGFLTLVAYVLQNVLPKVSQAGNAQVLVVHAVFFSVAMSVSFPTMLVLAFVNGILWDCLTMAPPITQPVEQMLGDGVLSAAASGMSLDLPIGFTALFFALFGALAQGVRPLFGKGRWEFPLLLTGISVFCLQVLEALVYSLFRLRFEFSADLLIKIGTQSIFVMSLAPFLIFLVHKFARWSQYLIVPGTPIRLRYGR